MVREATGTVTLTVMTAFLLEPSMAARVILAVPSLWAVITPSSTEEWRFWDSVSTRTSCPRRSSSRLAGG